VKLPEVDSNHQPAG